MLSSVNNKRSFYVSADAALISPLLNENKHGKNHQHDRRCQKILENAETHGRLQSGTGFGDHVDAEIPVAQALESVAYGQGRKPRAGEQQLDSVPFAAEEIPCGARSEIGSAYADHDQRAALGADPGRGGLDAGKLAGEHAVGQLKPAGKVRAGSAPLRESAVGLFAFSPVGALVTPESGRAGQIYFYHVG